MCFSCRRCYLARRVCPFREGERPARWYGGHPGDQGRRRGQAVVRGDCRRRRVGITRFQGVRHLRVGTAFPSGWGLLTKPGAPVALHPMSRERRFPKFGTWQGHVVSFLKSLPDSWGLTVKVQRHLTTTRPGIRWRGIPSLAFRPSWIGEGGGCATKRRRSDPPSGP